MNTLAIIGCGGSGSWAVQMLSKSPKRELDIVLVDGDKWEQKNADRCLVPPRHIGRHKITSSRDLLERAGWLGQIHSWPYYLALGTEAWLDLLARQGQLRVLSCVDNHAARRLCLRLADERAQDNLETIVVLTGNEMKSASADVYLPSWRGSKLDPRVRYPEIETSDEGNPLHPSCTGEAAESSPQLALANGLSAFSGLWLMQLWAEEEPARRGGEYYREIMDSAPVSVQWTALRQTMLTRKDVENE